MSQQLEVNPLGFQNMNDRVAIIREWESRSDLYPKGLLVTDSNLRVINTALLSIPVLTLENMVAKVAELIQQQRLEFAASTHPQAPPPASADVMPHSGVLPALDGFNYVEDFNDTKKVSNLLRDAARFTGGSNNKELYNFIVNVAFIERQKFIKDRNLRAPKTEVASATPVTRQSLPDFLQTIEDKATLADLKEYIAHVRCQTSAKTASVQDLLKTQFNTLLARGIAAKVIVNEIKKTASKYEPADSSIR